jgi:hypothetical protein
MKRNLALLTEEGTLGIFSSRLGTCLAIPPLGFAIGIFLGVTDPMVQPIIPDRIPLVSSQ